MEHKLIEGGEQYLPFARSRIKSLRRLGTNYAAQQFDMPGDVTVVVRIVGDHEYIWIKGDGGWLAYPLGLHLETSAVHNKPVFDTTVSYTPIPYPDPPPVPNYQYTAVPPQGNGSKLGIIFAFVYTYAHGLYPSGEWHDYYSGGPGSAIPNGYTTYPGASDGGSASAVEWLFDYYAISPGPTSSASGADWNTWEHGRFDAWNNEVAQNISWIASETARYQAELAADAAVNNPLQSAYAAALHNYYFVDLPAVDAANAAGYAAVVAAMEAQKATARVSARPAQVQTLLTELDRGVLTPWVCYDTLPPPINPRGVQALPFPITIKKATDAGGGITNYEYEITDYSVDPSTTRTVSGTHSNVLMGGIAQTCGGTYNRSTFVNVWVGTPITDIEHMVNPGVSFGYFITGYLERLEGGVRVTATYQTPTEYLAYLQSGLKTADVDAAIDSDAYIQPGTTVTLVHFEWETYDEFTKLWTWVAAPDLVKIDPVFLCGVDGQDVGSSPRVRAVRLRKITRQTLGQDRTWSSPVPVEFDPQPTFDHTVVPTSIEAFPPAIAILQKLPGTTLPARIDGNKATASVNATRLSSDPTLRTVLQTEWTGDPTASDWTDRLVMEALNLTRTYKANAS